ncbi:ubiquinol-cytochrome-c reductase complex subunit-domain-containing protein [Scleroderma yunnanense]
MARVVFQSTSPLGQPKMFLRNWGPSLGMWGVGAGTAALFVLSVTPVVRNGLLVRVPVIGDYFEDKTPASDKSF